MSGLSLLCTKFTLFCNEIPENCNLILTNQNWVIFSCIILIYLQHSEIKFFLYTNYLSADQVFEFVIKFQVFFWSRHFTCYHSLYLQCLCGTIKLIRVLHSGHYHQPKLIIKLMCFFSQDVMMIRDKII